LYRSAVTFVRMAQKASALAGAVLLLACLVVGSAGCSSGPPLDVAPSVDLSRMTGKWYEIARLPRTTQTDCHGTTAFYSQNADGTLTLVNQCNVGTTDGPLDTVTMSATVPDPSTPAKLALNVGGYSGDYWLLEVGSNYDYAVVGHPSRLYLWILSRAPTLDSATLDGVVSRAQSNHFDTAQLIYTPQPPPGERTSSDAPVGAVPPAPSSSCSASGATHHEVGAWAGAIALAALAVASRRRFTPLR
jgi:apolipoprotein D and lipocalin family protein